MHLYTTIIAAHLITEDIDLFELVVVVVAVITTTIAAFRHNVTT